MKDRAEKEWNKYFHPESGLNFVTCIKETDKEETQQKPDNNQEKEVAPFYKCEKNDHQGYKIPEINNIWKSGNIQEIAQWTFENKGAEVKCQGGNEERSHAIGQLLYRTNGKMRPEREVLIMRSGTPDVIFPE